jgi:prepilin-type N-terminal cleavage/methylation domain-containing protein
VFDSLFERHRELQRRRADEGFDGFTLIELLIVIVVIAILAATVIFALGGVSTQSAQAACNSDAKSVEVAVEAYHSYPGNAGNLYPSTLSQLKAGVGGSGPFIHSLPNNTSYTVGLQNDSNGPGGATATSGGDDIVYVTPNAGPTSATAGTNYDNQTATTDCNAVK